MLGSIINALAIIIGSLIGIFARNRLSEQLKDISMQAVGLSVIIIGLVSTITNLQDPKANPVLFIISLAVGGVVGQCLDIESKIKRLGDFLEAKLSFGKSASKNSISQGFVSASILFCVGSMAILGSLESGIKGVHNILFAKSMLDGVTSIMFASTMGIGVMLSGASVMIYQGSLTFLSNIIEPYLTTDMIREISIVGGVIVTGIGIDMLQIRKINVANFLPAVIVPVFYYLIRGFFLGN